MGTGADLREIQRQLDALDTRIDPEQVGQFLTIRRDVMFLEFDVAIRHSLRDTLLATGNVPAYRVRDYIIKKLNKSHLPHCLTHCHLSTSIHAIISAVHCVGRGGQNL